MRDCFRRELYLQKQTKSGEPGTMYFEQMLFLMPQTKDCATSSNCSPVKGSNGEEDTDERREDKHGPSGGRVQPKLLRVERNSAKVTPRER